MMFEHVEAYVAVCAAIVTTIGFSKSTSDDPINALNPINLNSFRIKSAQSSERRRKQNYGRIAYI